MNHKLFIIFFLVVLLSCETRTASKNEHHDFPLVTIKPLTNFAEYFDAILVMEEPSGYDLQAGKVRFVYDIRNFPLSAGNYIMINLNNKELYPTTKPEASIQLLKENYMAVSFLCLANHISLKNYGNYVARTFNVHSAPAVGYDESAPMIFYNYPRGRIKMENNGQILMDFYLLNTALAANGHKAKIELSGQEFVVTEWIPYTIEGLVKGEHEIKLTLLDRNDRIVDSPFNQATGSFVLY
jgi:hypothetical protein